MYPIKQSTAITIPFFVHDVSGDAVTGLVDAGFVKRISKNGAAFAAMTVTITEMENGWYSIPLSTAHSDTLGLLTILFTHGSAKQVNLQFRVHVRVPDDLAFPTVAGRSLDVAATGEAGVDFGNILGTLDAADIGANAITAAKIAADAIGAAQIASNALTAAKFAAASLDGKGDWNIGKTGYTLTQTFPANFSDLAITVTTGRVDVNVNNDKAGYALTVVDKDDVADRVWDEARSGHVAAGSFGQGAASVQGDVTGNVDGNVGGNVAGSVGSLGATAKADVNAEVADVFKVDTITLPGAAAPPLAPTFEGALSFLYKAFRNKKTQTATEWGLYNDTGTIVEQKATVSDAGGVATKGKIAAGP